MSNRTVRDVMTSNVVLVNDSAGYKEIVRRMEESKASALPVVDADRRLVGIVSEADLLLKEEHAVEPRRSRIALSSASSPGWSGGSMEWSAWRSA